MLTEIDWPALLVEALTKPGVTHDAYHRFWNYSLGNQALAWWQCSQRSLEPGPLNTFRAWKELGRQVRKGEKALTLCMPVTIPAPKSQAPPDDPLPETVTRFIFRARWFVLSQTDGPEYRPPPLPNWDEDLAFAALGVHRTSFDELNGNVQGFARANAVAVSPGLRAARTLFHELAHVVLGHTANDDRQDDDAPSTRGLREVEAEAVALICAESLGLPGIEESRGYIQHWLRGQTFSARSAHRVFRAADQILKAGRQALKGDDVP